MRIIPERMTIAIVIPIFKSGKKIFTNNRTVSFLPQFSKILFFYDMFDKFLEMNGALSNSQYGFRYNCTTCHALLDLHEQLTKSMDKKLCTISVLFIYKRS